MAFENVKQAIEDIKAGKMVVMTDDEDRENEGDVVCAAAFCNEAKVNFMITHARGVLCTPLSAQLAAKFELSPMVASNTSCHETAFTISIDAAKAKTGVSAYERNMTIRMLVDPSTKAADFVRPGHIFPLIAKRGGVLERTGHTEGSVDLCALAGLAPVSVICEIVRDDGEMARRDDLVEFCTKHGLNMISVSELIEYRLHHEQLISVSKPKASQIAGLPAQKYELSDHLGNTHFAYTFGALDTSKPVNVKFHRIKTDHELLSMTSYDEFIKSLKTLKTEGGMLVFLSGKSSKEAKSYGIGAQILRHFDIKQITLLSENESQEFAAISGFGLDIVGYKN